MNPDECQDQALRRSEDTSPEQQSESLSMSPFILQRAQPITRKKLRTTIQAALDLIDFLDEEFEALDRSVVVG
jgi:hypothetical protein